jgi:[acyl-carrier-protein] S-malonyltransferase
MHRAARRLHCALAEVELRAPRITVYSSVTAAPMLDPRVEVARALTEPVLWVQTIRALAGAGVTRFAEAHAGHVLGDLVLETLTVNEPAPTAHAIAG